MAEAAIPDLVPEHRWWMRPFRMGYCPACGMPWAASMWTMSAIGYPMHYAMVHLRIPVFRRLGDD
jgi:hypothetical protein